MQQSWHMPTCSLVAYKRLEQSKAFPILIFLCFLLLQVNYYFFHSTIQNASHHPIKKNASHHTVVGDREVQLSKVQKQQKTIAHTIIRSPEILLIDKATSALDTNYERMF